MNHPLTTFGLVAVLGGILLLVPPAAAASLSFTNTTVGDPFTFAWNGTYDYAHDIVWTFNVTLPARMAPVPLVVSVPFEFGSKPTGAQAGPILHDTIYYNGIEALGVTTGDRDGGSIGNPNGFEWEHVMGDGGAINVSMLHPGPNVVTVVANLTFAAGHRSGIFNVSVGPARVTTIEEKSLVPAWPVWAIPLAMLGVTFAARRSIRLASIFNRSRSKWR